MQSPLPPRTDAFMDDDSKVAGSLLRRLAGDPLAEAEEDRSPSTAADVQRHTRKMVAPSRLADPAHLSPLRAKVLVALLAQSPDCARGMAPSPATDCESGDDHQHQRRRDHRGLRIRHVDLRLRDVVEDAKDRLSRGETITAAAVHFVCAEMESREPSTPTSVTSISAGDIEATARAHFDRVRACLEIASQEARIARMEARRERRKNAILRRLLLEQQHRRVLSSPPSDLEEEEEGEAPPPPPWGNDDSVVLGLAVIGGVAAGLAAAAAAYASWEWRWTRGWRKATRVHS